MKSWIKDILAVVIFLSIGLLAGYILYLDKTSESEYKGTQIVGKIVTIKNESVRIPGDRAREFSLKKPGDVYLYETLRVSSRKGSQIVLKLSEDFYDIGNEIILYEGAVIKFTPEGFRTEGSVSIETAEGKREDISGNFEATVEGKGINIKTVKLVAQYPVNTEIIVTAEEYPVQFQWREEEPVTAKKIQISYKQDFSKILTEQRLPDGDTFVTVNLSPGTYYWRISGESYGSGYTGPETIFSLFRYKNPVLISPEAGSEISYYNKLDIDLRWDEAVLFTGNEDIKADSYLLEITKDGSFDDFKPILLGQKTKYTVTQDLLREEGTYQWRVTPSFKIIKNLTGGARKLQDLITDKRGSLSFNLARSLDVGPLKLNYPLDGAEFNVLDVRNGISFNWEKDREIDNFRFQIAADSNFNRIIYEDIVDYYSFMLNSEIPTGRYYWRVEGLITDAPGRLSEVRSLTVKELEGGIAQIYPDPDRIIELNPDNPQVTFKWETDLPADEYRLILYKGDSDNPFLRENTKETSLRLNLSAPENFRWQVVLLDEMGRIIKSSPIQDFGTIRPFRPPLLVYPANNQSLSVRGENEITFYWEKVQTADSYRFQLFKEGSEQPLLSRKTESVELKLEDLSLLSAGGFYVTLQSVRNNPPAGLSGESTVSVNPFTIEEFIVYTSPVLISPAENASVDIVSLRKRGLPFSWRQDPRMTSFSVDIFNSQNPETPYRTVQTDRTEFTLNDLVTGNYTWRIRSYDKNGRPAPESPAGQFRVTDIPALPAPVVLNPRDGAGINMENYNSLDFSWSYINGADFYDIKLYDLKNGKTVFEERVKGTGYSLQDLELLDVGTFYFEVRAYKENSDLAVPTPQYSPVSRSTFSIFLQDAYDSPNIISPDTQYTR